MPDHRLRTLPPDPKLHAFPIADLCAKVFSQFGYYELMEDYRTVYLRNSHYDWDTSRIGLLGDRLITHFGVWDYQMRIGAARVRCAGVGAVATDAEFRKRGYMARTASACVEAMRAAGYDFSVLFGISGFYHRFGYVRAWSDTDFYVRAADLPQAGPASPLRRLHPRPRPDLAELYNRQYALATGTAVRPTYRRGYPHFMRPQHGYVWTSSDRRLAGYVMVTTKGNRLDCWECCGDAQETLRVLGALARRWGCESVRFETLPYFSELARRLRRGDCRVETRHHRSGGAMMQLLNLGGALAKMAPELSRRLRRSPLADWEGTLLLSDGREEAALNIKGGRVSPCAPRRTSHSLRGDRHLAQLLLGSDAPGEIIEAGGFRLTGDARWLIPIFFSQQGPTLSALDRF